MKFKELVAANRSRRKFDQARPVDVDTLVELVDLARLGPSGMNKQPLKYIVTADQAQCEDVFPLLGWAGYLKEWQGPEPGERPTGYIIILLDKTIADKAFSDHGIAAQTMMLGAVEKGLGGCMIGTIKRRKLAELLKLDEQYEILLVLALGVPNEKVVIEPLSTDNNIEYWRDADNIHHVPKRGMSEVVLAQYPKG